MSEEADALRMAQDLASVLWEKHYKAAAPDWKPADNLIGVVLQLDNITAGMNYRIEHAETSLKVYDEALVSEYWERYPNALASTHGEPANR